MNSSEFLFLLRKAADKSLSSFGFALRATARTQKGFLSRIALKQQLSVYLLSLSVRLSLCFVAKLAAFRVFCR